LRWYHGENIVLWKNRFRRAFLYLRGKREKHDSI
jgi:hypothetical protein